MTFALLKIRSADRAARRAVTICAANGGLAAASPVAASVPAAPAFFRNSRRGIGLSLMVRDRRFYWMPAALISFSFEPSSATTCLSISAGVIGIGLKLLEPLLHRW